MKRSITLITLCVLIVVSYGLYNLKYEVEDLQYGIFIMLKLFDS